MEPEAKTQKSYYPIQLDVQGKPCLVVGGGSVARRKSAALIDCGAQVMVISPKVDPVLQAMVEQGELHWLARAFQPTDLVDVFLAIAATNDRDTNRLVGQLCQERRILCNIADAPDESDFINPSTIERGPLSIAISTSGISPSLVARIRQELEMAYGEEYGVYLLLLADLRPRMVEAFPEPAERTRVYDQILASRVLSLLRNGLMDEARREINAILQTALARKKKN